MHGSLCVVDNTAPSIINCVDVSYRIKTAKIRSWKCFLYSRIFFVEIDSVEIKISL